MSRICKTDRCYIIDKDSDTTIYVYFKSPRKRFGVGAEHNRYSKLWFIDLWRFSLVLYKHDPVASAMRTMKMHSGTQERKKDQRAQVKETNIRTNSNVVDINKYKREQNKNRMLSL